MYMEEIYDSKFIYFVVLEVLGKEGVIRNEVKQNHMDFAEQLFQIRLQNQSRNLERMMKFYSFINEHMNALKVRFQNEE